MKRRQREAVILALVDKLREQGNWCEEIHLQKAAYFLEELGDVPLGLGFILYKHGPFSFELRDEITAMRADGLIQVHLQIYPHGPGFLTTDNGRRLQKRWPKTLGKYANSIAFVAKHLGRLGVAELERVATALYITKKYPGESVKFRANRLHELKPHIQIREVENAIREIDRIIKLRHPEEAKNGSKSE